MFDEGELIERYESISIPFAEGDYQGMLTREIIDKIATQTSLLVVNSGGDLTLLVTLKQQDEENIGFRFDRNGKGRRIDYIIPSETRISLFAEVTVIEQASGCALIGPFLFEASYDFDHDYYSSQNAVNIFSMGQLTDYDEALDAALRPLYQNLADKIADYVKNAW